MLHADSAAACVCLRLLAIARGALGLRLERRFVDLLLDATGPPSRAEAPSLAAALSCLHILTRTHPNLRLLHAVAGAAVTGDSPAAPEAASTGGGLAAAELPYEEPVTAETDHEREERWRQQDLLLQHFVIPPLEAPLELPWGLAEAPLLPAWRLQRQQKREQLQLFSLRNSQVSDLLAAPLHAFDLLLWKLTVGGLYSLRNPQGSEALMRQQLGAVEHILFAYQTAAKMLLWEERGHGPLSDCGDDALFASVSAAADTKSSGQGGCLSSLGAAAADAEGLAAALSKCPPLCLSPSVSSALDSIAAELVGELTLGATALLQHGDVPGALECIGTFSCAAAETLQSRRIQALAQQQRHITRRRLQKAAEGPQRAVAVSQRLTALAVRELFLNSARGEPLRGAPESPKCFEVIDENEPCQGKELAAEAIDLEEEGGPLKQQDEAPVAKGAPFDCGRDFCELFDSFGSLEPLAFASVGTMLHGGEELRRALLAEATQRQQSAARGRGSKGGRGRWGVSLIDPQAKLETILNVLETHAE